MNNYPFDTSHESDRQRKEGLMQRCMGVIDANETILDDGGLRLFVETEAESQLAALGIRAVNFRYDMGMTEDDDELPEVLLVTVDNGDEDEEIRFIIERYEDREPMIEFETNDQVPMGLHINADGSAYMTDDITDRDVEEFLFLDYSRIATADDEQRLTQILEACREQLTFPGI